MFSVLPKQKAITYFESDIPFLIIAGENAVVCTMNLNTYNLIDTWAVGHPVESLCCVQFNDHMIIAAGCATGAVCIRQDWDIISTHNTADDNKIIDLRFIKNGESLVASGSDSNIYIFKYTDKEYQICYVTPIDTGIPLSLDVSYEKDSILISTDKKKLMMSKI